MTHDKTTRDDRRVQRTRTLIVDALIELTIQKGFAAVTVRDIVERAGINRATFYRHYQDKFDLLDQYAQALNQLPDSAPEHDAGATVDQMIPGLIRVMEHVRLHAKFFRVMLSKNGDPAFADKIRKYIQQRIRRMLPTTLLSDQNLAEVYLTYVANGAVGVLSWWLEAQMPYSSEQLVVILSRFLSSGLAALSRAES